MIFGECAALQTSSFMHNVAEQQKPLWDPGPGPGRGPEQLRAGSLQTLDLTLMFLHCVLRQLTHEGPSSRTYYSTVGNI